MATAVTAALAVAALAVEVGLWAGARMATAASVVAAPAAVGRGEADRAVVGKEEEATGAEAGTVATAAGRTRTRMGKVSYRLPK